MRALIILTYFSGSAIAQVNTELKWMELEKTEYRLRYTITDKNLETDLKTGLQKGTKLVTGFFNAPFQSKFDVFIFPERKNLDAQWKQDWNDSTFNSECWMVASGTAKRLDVLSPNAWPKEACDHNANDKDEIEKIIAHELTHVYHAQRNPKPNFDGMDNLSWFVEGLATYASGQLTDSKLKNACEQLKVKAPDQLENIWKGKTKYQMAGSLVKYLDQAFGRKKLIELLVCTTEKEILSSLQQTEQQLLENWKSYMRSLN